MTNEGPAGDSIRFKWRIPQPTIEEVNANEEGAVFYDETPDGERRYGYRTCSRCGEPVSPCVPDCCEMAFHHDEDINAKCVALSKRPDEDDTILTANCACIYWSDEEQDTIRWYMLFDDYAHLIDSHQPHIESGTPCHCAKYIEVWPDTDAVTMELLRG